MKTCLICGSALYSKGLCLRHYEADYRLKNIERVRGYQRTYRSRNLARVQEAHRKYVANNNEKVLATAKNARAKHKDYYAAYCRSYQAGKRRSTPLWAKDEFGRFAIEEMYGLATKRTQTTGIPWQVDHIVPLNSKVVCGLHCVANLRVIPKVENIRKGNRIWPDM